MTEAEARAAVVAEAKTWLGTPYHHAGDIKGLGVDCGMLLVRVFEAALGLKIADPRPYAADRMFHCRDEAITGIVEACGAYPVGAATGPGDIVLWRHGHSFSHCGIVIGWPLVIHAHAKTHKVEEVDVTHYARLGGPKHPRRFFSLWH